MSTACATGWCGGAECDLWWSEVVIAPYIPTNVILCVHALYGIATASRHVIGYQIVFPVGLFSAHSWFPFKTPSTPPAQPSAPVLLHMESHTTHTHTQWRRLLIHLHTPLTVAFFGNIVIRHLPQQYPHVLHTREEYCFEAFAHP